MELIEKELCGQIIQAFYDVYNSLGYGFLEKVYENALTVELRSMGLECSQQYPIDVFYQQHKVGSYFADVIVEDKVIIELKASANICLIGVIRVPSTKRYAKI